MNELPIMLVMWGVCVAAFVALMLYSSHLTRQEVAQVFLNENTDEGPEAQLNDIVRRVNRISPVLQTFGGAAALLTLAIVGVYVANILPHVRF